MREFKYVECDLDESGTDAAECRRKIESRRKVEDAIRSLVNTKSLDLECAMVLNEACSCLFHCMVVRQWYGRRK